MRIGYVVVGAALAGCGLDTSGLGAGGDAGTDVVLKSHDARPHLGDGDGHVAPERDASPSDSRSDTHRPDVASPPAPCSLPPGPCVGALPAGWQLVTYESSQVAACPAPLSGIDVVSNPTPLAGACGCACEVTSPPVCDQGSLPRMISDDTSCSTPGVTLTVSGPECSPWAASSSALYAYAKAAALPASNGACTASPTTSVSDVSTASGRVCSLPTDCQEQACGGAVAAGFSLCISQAGAQSSCPAGWGTPTVVGASVDLACSACTCDLTSQSTCTSASLQIYADGSCTDLLATVAVDGVCTQDPAAGMTPVAFKYSATLNQVCATAGAKLPTVTLASPETICCKP